MDHALRRTTPAKGSRTPNEVRASLTPAEPHSSALRQPSGPRPRPPQADPDMSLEDAEGRSSGIGFPALASNPHIGGSSPRPSDPCWVRLEGTGGRDSPPFGGSTRWLLRSRYVRGPEAQAPAPGRDADRQAIRRLRTESVSIEACVSIRCAAQRACCDYPGLQRLARFTSSCNPETTPEIVL